MTPGPAAVTAGPRARAARRPTREVRGRAGDRGRSSAALLRAAGVAGLAGLVGIGAVAYRTGPPPGHTGAFGEPDCGECHFDAIRDDPAGSATLDGPDRYRPGVTYELTVAVRHPDLAAAGFQLSARFLDGERTGSQAGRLEAAGPDTRVEVGENDVAYATQTAEGAAVSGAGDGVRRWSVRWTAPDSGGAVSLDAAANAANDDDSELGDRIYRAHRTVAPPPVSPAVSPLPPPPVAPCAHGARGNAGLARMSARAYFTDRPLPGMLRP